MLHHLYFVLLLILSRNILPVTGIDHNTTYIGAVVQYHSLIHKTKVEGLPNHNTVHYDSLIKTASANGADIIVFPEYGLTGFSTIGIQEHPFRIHLDYDKVPSDDPRHLNTFDRLNLTRESDEIKIYRAYYYSTASLIPSPDEEAIPCFNNRSSYAEWLTDISCSAADNEIYVVVNGYERINCSPTDDCPSDGFFIYNTNVVFDREGRVIARYRKHHLFVEPWVDRPAHREMSIFVTDFNVTFAQLFDIEILHFPETLQFIRQNTNVTDLIYVTRRFDELPLLLTSQDRFNWAEMIGVNMLAAGFNIDGGSGVRVNADIPVRDYHYPYWGGALVIAEMPKLDRRITRKPLPELQVKAIPITIGKPITNGDSTHFKSRGWTIGHYFDPEHFVNLTLDPKVDWTKQILCIKEVCCNFEVETKFNENLANQNGTVYYRYQLMALSATFEFSDGNRGGIELCAAIACIDDNILSCGRRFPENETVVQPTSIKDLTITRSANLHHDGFYGPLGVGANGSMQANLDYQYIAGRYENVTRLLMTLKEPQSEFRIFGINGRRFDMDQHPSPEPSYFWYSVILGVALSAIVVFALDWIWKRSNKSSWSPDNQEELSSEDVEMVNVLTHQQLAAHPRPTAWWRIPFSRRHSRSE